VRVLITGHQGYIGRVMAPMLQARGHDVVGLDSGLYADCTFGPRGPWIPTISKDIRDATTGDCEGFDAVIHLAGICNDPLSDLRPELTMDVNYRAAVRFAKLAKRAGVRRFLNSSSCSVYGASGDAMADENTPPQPLTVYAVSKQRLEAALSKLATKEFSPVNLRNATVYGVSSGLRLDLALNDMVATATVTGRVLVKSDGTPWRPIAHVEDIGRAFLAALEAPTEAVHNQVFNIGRNEENYRVSELAGIVRETVPGCVVEYAAGGGPDKRCYRVDCSKVRNRLPGFQPVWNARDGARQLHQAFIANGFTVEDLRGARYIRLQQVRKLMAEGTVDADIRMNPVKTATASGD
jgi:nucleoside-diphosphate-sugar epimerase